MPYSSDMASIELPTKPTTVWLVLIYPDQSEHYSRPVAWYLTEAEAKAHAESIGGEYERLDYKPFPAGVKWQPVKFDE